MINLFTAKEKFEKGVFYYQNGELNKALEEFREAVKINPNYTEAYCNIGELLKIKVGKALQDLSKTLNKWPPNNKDYNSYRLLIKNWFEEAVEKFNIALMINPNFIEAKNELEDLLKYNDFIQLL